MVTPPAVVAPAWAASDPALGFAFHLFETGEYFRAVGEFERWRFSHAADPHAGHVSLMVAHSYLRGGRYAQAALRFQGLLDVPSIERQARYGLALSYEAEGSVEAATRILAPLLDDQAYRRAASAHMGSLLASRGRWREALAHLQEAEATASFRVASAHLARWTPSPVLAGVMSGLVPGAGQWYSGRGEDGLASFLMTASFVAASAYYFQRGNQPLAFGTGGLGLGFWGASVFGAVNAARHTDQAQESEALRAVRAGIAPCEPALWP